MTAIEKVHRPNTKDELKSFIGLAEYCAKCVKNFMEIVEPFRGLMKKGAEFDWTEECESVFFKIKESFVQAPTLGHFEVTGRAYVTTDASKVGIGAVLTQVKDGIENVIGFTSRRLQRAETEYSVIERDTLACCWGINRFRFYVCEIPFKLRTDHKPLTYIFKGGRGLEGNVVPSIARWL